MRPPTILLLSTGLALAGCRDTKITYYRVPKETPAETAADAADSGAPAIRYQAPADWQAQSGDSERQGSFLVAAANGAKADISIITFPGDVGGDLANVNRWRSQVQLPPIDASALRTALTDVATPAGTFHIVDVVSQTPMAGGAPARILGAILSQPAQTWFFKMIGDADLVEAQKPAFLRFLQTVQFNLPSGAGAVANTNDLPPDARGLPGGGSLPAGHPAIPAGTDMANTPVAVAAGPSLVWTAPADWKPTAGSAMRKGSYAVTGPEGTGDLSITAFPGDVGGALANINRWRGQLGLPPVAAVEDGAQPLDANGLSMLVFDAANGGQAILAAIVARPTETWFFKLTGPDALVARTKPAFLDFLRTVKAP